uniref:Un-named hu7910 n=1 Tax=Tetraodon nigroviridis TaxID=99883 RepID=H3CMI4_TETNG
TLFVVLALLGVLSSMAVLYLDVVDYRSILGRLAAYDADGDGDFDMEDAKVLLGKRRRNIRPPSIPPSLHPSSPPPSPGPPAAAEAEGREVEAKERAEKAKSERLEQERMNGQPVVMEKALVEEPPAEDGEEPAAQAEPERGTAREAELGSEASNHSLQLFLVEFTCKKSQNQIAESIPYLKEGLQSGEPGTDDGRFYFHLGDALQRVGDSSFLYQSYEYSGIKGAEPTPSPEQLPDPGSQDLESEIQGMPDSQAEEKPKEKGRKDNRSPAKRKKPKLLNKFDKTIKAEIDAAEKLRKKGKLEEALRAFEALVQLHPQSPRARYGKAQTEDDQAEKLRSNDMLQRAINTYREASELPDATPDLLRAALRRRAERQQFLGSRMRGALLTLEKLTQIFPDDIGLKNDLGVAHLLLGDNKGAKRVYEEVLAVAPTNGFAKVHYGFILKSQNQIAESIPYLKEGLQSGEPGTDDGRFYFHLGDALQRVGDSSAYHWYQVGHQRGHFASVWQRSLYNVKGLKAQPWWTPKETGYTDLVKALERNWKSIRDEALAVMDQKSGLFIPEEENLREKGEWGQYTLWQQGKKLPSSCQSVPKTCSLLERFPEATGCKRGQIKFSVMQPGTHVWPHTGPTNCRLRMHLGLVIPPHGCRIRCTEQTREWQEGKVLIFDDSFEHEVWQEADSYRLIFIVDVWHPELTASQRQALSPI